MVIALARGNKMTARKSIPSPTWSFMLSIFPKIGKLHKHVCDDSFFEQLDASLPNKGLDACRLSGLWISARFLGFASR